MVSAASGQILTTSAAAAAAAAAANLPPPHAAAAPLTATLGHPLEVGKKRAAENDAMFQLVLSFCISFCMTLSFIYPFFLARFTLKTACLALFFNAR